MEQVQLDQERQKKAKDYARINHRLMLFDLIVTGIYAIAWLICGWSAGLKNWTTSLTPSAWLQVLVYAAVFAGILSVLDLPMNYYSDFILPHRFEQSTQSLRDWIIDQVKGLLISAILAGIVLEIIYAVLRAYPVTWWIWVSIILLIFSVILANLAPVILMPMFNKFVPLGDEYQELKDRLNQISLKAGTKVKGVYKFDLSRRTKSANAALTGLGSTRRIILGDTLINEFTIDEIETVLAHELGHHVNRDISLLIIVQTLSTVIGLWLASFGLKWGSVVFGFSGPADVAALPVLLIVIGLFGLVTMPLTNAFSRWREKLADGYALRSTHNAPAFISAMTRLANQNLADVDPEPWVEFLIYSHPALSKRIAMAQDFIQHKTS
jgi:STE24 endopeptidase